MFEDDAAAGDVTLGLAQFRHVYPVDSAATIDQSLVRPGVMASKQRVSKANYIAAMGFEGIYFDDLEISKAGRIHPIRVAENRVIRDRSCAADRSFGMQPQYRSWLE